MPGKKQGGDSQGLVAGQPRVASAVEDQGVIRLGDVGFELKRLQWRHHREANHRLAPAGISYAQWDVLRHLARQPDASLHALAELTFQTDQSMGALAKRMVERGLIERIQGPGRAVRHQLTTDGEKTHAFGVQVMASVLNDSLGQLSNRELGTLKHLLQKANG